jgi:hypothetical protein
VTTIRQAGDRLRAPTSADRVVARLPFSIATAVSSGPADGCHLVVEHMGGYLRRSVADGSGRSPISPDRVKSETRVDRGVW